MEEEWKRCLALEKSELGLGLWGLLMAFLYMPQQPAYASSSLSEKEKAAMGRLLFLGLSGQNMWHGRGGKGEAAYGAVPAPVSVWEEGRKPSLVNQMQQD